jgi:hypothetical protein
MLRYYPSFAIQPNLNTTGGEFLLNGQPYSGRYYETYDGRAFTGSTPEIGPSEPLERVQSYLSAPILANSNLSTRSIRDLANRTGVAASTTESARIPGQPNSYYPQPTEQDYKKGYVIRYFTKKENERGFVTEISQDEYNSIVNGTADYDISIYQTTTILWKLTGPLKSTRQSQYNVIPGIIDTNQRLTESANRTFLGIVDFIGGEYSKFARPTL